MLELIRALEPHDIACHVLVPRPGPLLSSLEARGIPYSVVPYRWWVDRGHHILRRAAKVAWSFLAAPLVAKAARRLRADVVYTNTSTVLSGALAARILAIPHVWHVHEFGEEDHDLLFVLGRRVSYWLMNRLSTRLIVNSNAVAEKYRNFIESSEIQVVYQSVTVDSAEAANVVEDDRSVFRCGIMGFLQDGKGQHEAIDAVAVLHDRGVPVELWVMGTGDAAYEERLRSRAKTAGIESRVRFTGFLEESSNHLRAMDVVLVCSRTEAFGRVTVEAMLEGKPVIGSDRGCTPELLGDGERGLVYRKGDISDLADKAMSIYECPETARRMGERGRRWAEEQFGSERYGSEVAAIIEGLVEQDSMP